MRKGLGAVKQVTVGGSGEGMFSYNVMCVRLLFFLTQYVCKFQISNNL